MKYSAEIERAMKAFYDSLSEKERRRYAALEAAQLGHGGTHYIATVLGCDPKTIRHGQHELDALPDPRSVRLRQAYRPDPRAGRVRRPGGGRKRCLDTIPHLEENFLRVLRDHTAGDPMRDGIRGTNLTHAEIAQRLKQAGTPVSVTVVKQLLRKHRYVSRKAQKAQTMGEHAARNQQFENIARLKQEYLESDNPIVSVDTKKKELVGNFSREGTLYTQEVLATFDPDFPSAASGVVIPHGLYDVKRNDGHVNLGTSHDTGEFACDSLEHWWDSQGRALDPGATSILLLCDGGGSNNASHYLFKEDLQRLVDRLGIEIRVAHYPPYTSKYNPIEHRLFPHLTRACRGVIFTSVELVKQLMEQAKTSTGLHVTVDILDKVYETGRKYAEGFKEEMKIVFDEILPKWNYRAVPTGS
jgi:Rhodopirellula transposase DDE domain